MEDILQINKPGVPLQKGILCISYWCNFFVLLYVFTMPFVSAFAFTGTISLPLIFAVFLFILMGPKMVQTGKLPMGFLGFDIVMILLFLFFVFFSYVINGWGNTKSFNHTVAYISTFLLFYITIKFSLFNIEDKKLLFKRILQVLTYTTILSAVYGNIEFISSNVFGVNLNEYVPRATEASEYYTPVVLSLFYRARGFAPESGVYTQMLELFAPLTIYYLYFSGFCSWAKWVKALFTLTIFSGIVFAASSATFIVVPIAVLVSAIFYIKKIIRFFSKKSLFYYLKMAVIAIIILVINNYLYLYSTILLTINEKIDSFSLYDRQNRVQFFYDEFAKFSPIKKMIGAGPAATDLLGLDGSHVVISLYYNVTFELGLIGLCLLILLFSYLVFSISFIQTKVGFFLAVSIISGILHYYVVHDFWVPWFWFVGAFSLFYIKNNKEILS